MTPWWKFWDPQSGAIGGIITGLIIGGLWCLVLVI